MRLILSLLLVLLLLACAPRIIDKEHSVLYSMPAGSEFVLHQAIRVRPFHARAFIQYGQVVAESQVNDYYPYCEIELRDISPSEQIIQPNRFRLIKIVEDEYQAQRYISADGFQFVDDGLLDIGFASEYYVQPEQPSDVVKINCVIWDDVYEDHYLTIAEIRQALGEVMTVVLKPEKI